MILLMLNSDLSPQCTLYCNFSVFIHDSNYLKIHLKVFIYLPVPGHSWVTWDLVLWWGIEPRPPVLGVLNRWTVREISTRKYFLKTVNCTHMQLGDLQIEVTAFTGVCWASCMWTGKAQQWTRQTEVPAIMELCCEITLWRWETRRQSLLVWWCRHRGEK